LAQIIENTSDVRKNAINLFINEVKKCSPNLQGILELRINLLLVGSGCVQELILHLMKLEIKIGRNTYNKLVEAGISQRVNLLANN
jgi:hypothetical protein